MRLLPRRDLATATRAVLLASAAVRIGRGARRAAPLGAGPPWIGGIDGLDTRADATVVIPARDEANRIGPGVRALVEDGARVLVVDDASSDDTRRIAEAAGATVVSAGPLPDGWAGKAHALHVGLTIAATRVVICLDADTRPSPGFVPAAIDALGDRIMVTAGARVDEPDSGARLVHASMLATLLYRFGPPGVDARPSRLLANGQCMILDRQAVLDAGGLQPVAASLVEDVALARHLARRGEGVAFVDATAVVDVAGYRTARGTLDGWGRSLALRDVTTMPWMVADLAVVWAAMALPLPRLIVGRGDAVDLAALGLRAGVVVATRNAFRHRGWPLAVAPLADLLVASRLTLGAIRPSRSWRGRDYARP